MKIKLALSMLLLAPVLASAGSETGTVSYVLVRASDGLIYFEVNGSKNSSPSCATKNYWIIKDENSETGKMQYSMLLAAAASGKTVKISGTGDCGRWGDGESVNELKFIQ